VRTPGTDDPRFWREPVTGTNPSDCEPRRLSPEFLPGLKLSGRLITPRFGHRPITGGSPKTRAGFFYLSTRLASGLLQWMDENKDRDVINK